MVDAEEAAAGRRRADGIQNQKQEPHRKMWGTKNWHISQPDKPTRSATQTQADPGTMNFQQHTQYNHCKQYIHLYLYPKHSLDLSCYQKNSRTSPTHRTSSMKLVKQVFIDLGNHTFLPAHSAGILKSGKRGKKT